MHGGRNKYDGFNNLIEMILKICEIAQFTRATPGSSLVPLHLLATSPDFCLIQQQGTRNKIGKSEKRGNATIANSLASSTSPFYRL